ncbi:MAG: DUF2892 domain-containing protein [Litoreibacter sp.]|nr:DUF2892 domain-containing protein [Litoreibacter sp.]
MRRNMGRTDRILRLIAGIVLFTAPLINFMGVWGEALPALFVMGIGAIFGLTAIFGICPLYSLFGWSTRSTG